MDSSLVIPITFWNSSKLVFRISTICITPNLKKVVTGSYSGQLCLWDLDLENNSITPKNLLIGHSDTVNCMASTNEYVISSCEGKVMCKWNLDDGYCSKMNKSLFIHRKMQLYVTLDSKEEFLFTSGDYSEIFVFHSFTLQVIFIFHSKISNTWISSFHIMKLEDKHVISGITTNGCVKVWTFDNPINDLQQETQCFNLQESNVVDFKYNSSLTKVLIVLGNSWVLYDLQFSNCFCRAEVCNEEKYLGGNFYDDDYIVLCTNSGKCYLYEVRKNEPRLISLFLDNCDKITVFEPALDLIETKSDKYLIKGDSQGKICFWKINLQQSELHPAFESALSDSFITNGSGLFDGFIKQTIVTSSIYVLDIDKFFVGCFDGSIIIIPAIESLMSFYFPSIFKKPLTDTLIGHKGKVNCLLYPNEEHSYFNKSHLVSGGSDFSVCLWDIDTLELLYRFCVQGGEILRLIIPPEDCNMSVKLSICSVSSDHSVAVLSLKDRRCLILTSRHKYPIVMVHWKPLDDFIIIECFDGTIYIWQMETGHLDRVINGVLAQEVIYACSSNNTNVSDFNFYINEQNGMNSSVKRKIYNVLGSTNSSPFRLNRFLTSEISESQMFFCDLESAFEKFCCSVESDGHDCVQSLDCYYLLTKTVSNDLQKNSVALFGKVKNDVFNSKYNHFMDRTAVATNPHISEGILNLIQFFLSLIHYWGLNPYLDEFFSLKLGLLKPEKGICFGIWSQPGIYSLFLPTVEPSQQRSSSLFTSICVAVTALTKILLQGKLSNEGLTELKKDWEKLFCFYDLTSRKIRKPKIEILARAWQNKCLPYRELIRKLFSNYLQALDKEEISDLLEFWYKYLPHFRILDKTLSDKFDFENVELKTVALVLFGCVGADLKFRFKDSSCQENYVYQTCSTFVYLLLLPAYLNLRLEALQTIAIDFIGRGFIVWEQFLKIEKIVPLLFSTCANLSNKSTDSSVVDKYFSAQNALKAIAIARTAAFVSCLKNEVTQISLGQNHFLTSDSKAEVLSILTFLLEKTPYIMLLYINDAISLIVYCIDSSHLKQENLASLIPVVQKFRQVHHSVASQRIAVGLATGSLVLHDLKTGKVFEVAAHKDSVSALKFSEDGKFLVSYSCYENRLCFWQVLTGIFGLGHINMKCTKSCQTYQIHDEEIRNHFEIASLTWTDKKSVLLSLCDGTEGVYHS